MPHRKLPARRDSVTSGAVLAQLAAVSSPDSPAAQIFPCDRTKFKESTLATRQSNGDGASTSADPGPKRSHWELRGVALIQVIAQPDDYLGNLEQELRAEGYEVQRSTGIREASDAMSALSYYPDVVLLDGGLSGQAERHMQNLKMFFNRSKTMVLGRFDASGQGVGITCIVAFRHGISDFMWYPSIGGLEELTARIERLLNNSHRAEVQATRQKAAAEKEEMMGRILRLREMQRQDAEMQKVDGKTSPEPASPNASSGAFKRCGTLSSMTEEGDEDALEEDELMGCSQRA